MITWYGWFPSAWYLGAFKLDHFRWLSPFYKENFQTFDFHAGECHFLISPENEKIRFSQFGWYKGVWVPGAFKLDHLQPVKPILFLRFSDFFTFILGAHSYYPRRLIIGKGNSPHSKYGWCRGVWVPGAFKLDHLQPVKLILFLRFSNFWLSCWGVPFPY